MDETPRQLISETREPVCGGSRVDRRAKTTSTDAAEAAMSFMAALEQAGRAAHDQGDGAFRTKTDWAHFLNEHRRAPPRCRTRITLVAWTTSTPTAQGALYACLSTGEAKTLHGTASSSGTTTRRSTAVGSTSPRSSFNVDDPFSRLNRRIDSLEILHDEVAAWQASRDRIQAKVNWQFTTDDARVKLKRLYPTLG